MRPVLFAAAAAAVAAACAWHWLRPIAPVDTPYFRWQPTAEDRYQLTVSHVGANPQFRRGVTTTPVPQSGALRVVGPPGSAEPGAVVEISNPRTGRGYTATAGTDGSFKVEVEAKRGDTFEVISRRLVFVQPAGGLRANHTVFAQSQ
jgi:hypothetical protein